MPLSTHGVFTSFNWSKCCYLHFWRKKLGSMLVQGYFKDLRSSINKRNCNFLHVSWHNQYELTCLLSGHYVMRRQVSMSFLLLLLYLITVACILEISLGLCWHKGWMYGSKVNHKSQCATFYKFEQPICNHHDHPMATCWNIYVQTLSQSNFHHNMEIHYLSVHWTWSWSSHFN